MIFLFIIPVIPAALGNFVVPLMVGAKDVAFSKLNLSSLYLYGAGALIALGSLVGGAVDSGWTFYTPYSSSASKTQVVAVTLGAFVMGFLSILTGLNFIVTIHRLRAPGMTWFRMPLFLWSIYATNLVQVLAESALGAEEVFSCGAPIRGAATRTGRRRGRTWRPARIRWMC
jgi:cytochrome c oxidase subunit 1